MVILGEVSYEDRQVSSKLYHISNRLFITAVPLITS